MSFNLKKYIKELKITIPIIFTAGITGAIAGVGIKNAIDSRENAKLNEYITVLKASGEVGNIETKAVLSFGDRQIVLTTDYTNAVKTILEPEEYPLFLKSFTEPLEQINNLKVGYNFTLTSEDGSFNLPTPKKNIPSVDWTISSKLGDTTVGEWVYKKNNFSEEYFFLQDPTTLNQISFPNGLETIVTKDNINDLDKITVYGEDYSTARMLTNYKIVNHELYHSLGVGHTDKNMNVPKNEGGILETYMTPTLNILYVGNSSFDENTLIASTCLRKILSGSQNKNDKYFDNSHYQTFNDFMQKGKENMNSNENSL